MVSKSCQPPRKSKGTFADHNLDLIHITISAILNFADAKVQGFRNAVPHEG
jgi:hypothetical protein